MQKDVLTTLVSSLGVASLFAGCATYTVPGRAADLTVFTDGTSAEAGVVPPGQESIAEILARRPAASFPTSLAVARVQAPDYRSHTIPAGHGRGAYSVITVRDVESEEDLARLRGLLNVEAVAPMSRLLIASELYSDYELREAAARLHADVLLVYTLDTVFELDQRVDPLGVITLGLWPTDTARIHTTAAALFLDTRTGYLYATAEATAERSAKTSLWDQDAVVDETRRSVEEAAFDGLIDEVSSVWVEVQAVYGPRPHESQ